MNIFDRYVRIVVTTAVGSACLSLAACSKSNQPSSDNSANAASHALQVAEGPKSVEGIEVKNLSRDGNLYVGGAATPDGLAKLKENGVATVIDLRQDDQVTAGEREAEAKLGLHRVSLPMRSDTMTPEQAERFLRAMDEHADAPILVQCGSANRAGAMYGLYLATKQKCPVQEALRRARAAGLRNDSLAGDVEEYVSRTTTTAPATSPGS